MRRTIKKKAEERRLRQKNLELVASNDNVDPAEAGAIIEGLLSRHSRFDCDNLPTAMPTAWSELHATKDPFASTRRSAPQLPQDGPTSLRTASRFLFDHITRIG